MKEIKALKRLLLELNYIIDKKAKRESIFLLLLFIVSAGLELISVSVFIPFLYVIMDIEAFKGNVYVASCIRFFHISSNIQLIFFICFCMVFLFLFKFLCMVFISYRQQKFSCGQKKDISVRMFKAYLYQPYTYYMKVNTADVIRGVTGDVESVYNALDSFLRIVSNIIAIIILSIYLFITDKVMALGVIIISAFCFGIILFLIKDKIKDSGYLQRIYSTEVYKNASQAIGGMKEVILFNQRETFLSRYHSVYEERRKIDIQYNVISAIPKTLLEAFVMSGLAIVVAIRYLQGGDMIVFITKLAVFAVAAVKLLPYISQIATYVSAMIYAQKGVAAVYENIKSVEKTVLLLENSNAQVHSFCSQIQIKNLFWKYAGQDRLILNNINFTIPKGAAVAIIGASGAGKTTLGNLILGLIKPEIGNVLVDGISIYDIPATWSKMIGYVPQDAYLLDDTIRNNILFGREDITEEEIWNSLKKAQLDDFVQSLPKQLDTVVGERGIKFSGGQRQRLSIARAISHNPDIMLLDEATSALDHDTEKAMMDAINALQGEKTLIIIAHRLSTIEQCDYIYEIKDGILALVDKETIFPPKSR